MRMFSDILDKILSLPTAEAKAYVASITTPDREVRSARPSDVPLDDEEDDREHETPSDRLLRLEAEAKLRARLQTAESDSES